jgi:hypothetical protein
MTLVFIIIAGGLLAFMLSILVPVLLGLAIFIFTVIIMVVIINLGSFVVPPNLISRASDSLYISVEKTPAPPGPFSNSQLSGTGFVVTYTIIVSPRRGGLRDISFEYGCNVYKEGSNPNCPNIQDLTVNGTAYATFQDIPPQTITSSEQLTITYTSRYSGNGFTDSLVFDSIRVNATTETGIEDHATGSASIIIGNPPTSCFTFSDNQNPWPSDYRAQMLSAAANVASQHPSFLAKVCAGGDVPLCYNSTPSSYWGWHIHGGLGNGCDVIFYSGAFTSQTDSEFILSHEVSHHLETINPSLYATYLDSANVINELPMCSYTATTDPIEGFAEMDGLYVHLPSYWGFRCNGSFQDLYPNHYQFAQDHVFN